MQVQNRTEDEEDLFFAQAEQTQQHMARIANRLRVREQELRVALDQVSTLTKTCARLEDEQRKRFLELKILTEALEKRGRGTDE